MEDLPHDEVAPLDGRFQLESLLGRGGMAEVYRAIDLRNGGTVAVKILREDVVDAIGVERFRREIAVTAAFTHPNILGLLESGESADSEGRRQLYYVMPLVEGETLDSRLAREGHLSLHDAVRITREVLQALAYAHEHGVIHRDVKPANILLSAGHAIVADFGIARPVLGAQAADGESMSLTVAGIALGTPDYMSPEQALSSSTVDARCDLYATGCVFYEMLTGHPPFDAHTGQAVMARKMSGVFVPPSDMRSGLPAAVDSIVANALAADSGDRFPSATDFLDALDQIDAATPVREAAIRPEASVLAVRRNWRGAPAIVLGIILALALVALVVWRRMMTL